MISPSTPEDFDAILGVINDAAKAYKGRIPSEFWKDPFMTTEQLRQEISAGVRFSLFRKSSGVVGVMGVQEVGKATLIRHAYVATAFRNQRIGKKLLQHLIEGTDRPVFMATWKAATWAVEFYKRNGFTELSGAQRADVLKTYWNFPDRQQETFTVLVDVRGLLFLKSTQA